MAIVLFSVYPLSIGRFRMARMKTKTKGKQQRYLRLRLRLPTSTYFYLLPHKNTFDNWIVASLTLTPLVVLLCALQHFVRARRILSKLYYPRDLMFWCFRDNANAINLSFFRFFVVVVLSYSSSSSGSAFHFTFSRFLLCPVWILQRFMLATWVFYIDIPAIVISTTKQCERIVVFICRTTAHTNSLANSVSKKVKREK